MLRWELSLHTLTLRQPERKVTWYWEEGGNTGKSFLADWLEVFRSAFIVTGGKFNDIAYAFDYQKYVVFDFARAQEERFPYKLLEDFSNKRIFSTKYRPIMKRTSCCRLIVFANFAPDRSKLSRDRWDVHHLDLNPMNTPIPTVIVE